MPANFGFLPTNQKGAYFISYNTEDSERVAPIARQLHENGVPVWYDYGLEYGEEWEHQIAAHIADCTAVIMFITKEIFVKERSYVRKEYNIAVKFSHKKVYVVMLDVIKDDEVPQRFWSWWDDILSLQCITNPTARKIMIAIGYVGESNIEKISPSELNEKGDDYYFGRNGVKQDYTEAVRYYRLAAEQGDVDALCSLAVCYKDGCGVMQDYAESAIYYKLAADRGNAYAQCCLGIVYASGYGVIQDYVEAVKYFRLSAEQGCADAQYNLGFCYYNGYGLDCDKTEAAKYFRLAAEQGYAYAQNNLGICYLRGYGVQQNYLKAVMYLRLAADQGNEVAKKNLRGLGFWV